MTLSNADLDAIIKTRTEPGDIVAELAKEVRRLREAVELSYKIARGHLNPVTLRPRDGFSVFGRSQIYWKGRSDAATDIRGDRKSVV